MLFKAQNEHPPFLCHNHREESLPFGTDSPPLLTVTGETQGSQLPHRDQHGVSPHTFHQISLPFW